MEINLHANLIFAIIVSCKLIPHQNQRHRFRILLRQESVRMPQNIIKWLTIIKASAEGVFQQSQSYVLEIRDCSLFLSKQVTGEIKRNYLCRKCDVSILKSNKQKIWKEKRVTGEFTAQNFSTRDTLECFKDLKAQTQKGSTAIFWPFVWPPAPEIFPWNKYKSIYSGLMPKPEQKRPFFQSLWSHLWEWAINTNLTNKMRWNETNHRRI